MKTILYLDSLGPQWWEQSHRGWHRTEPAFNRPVWVVTDLAEEGFSELPLPRIFGRDRADFIARHLASHFAQTPYRCAVAATHVGFWTRLVSPVQILLGVDAGERIDATLATISAPIAGVWCTSMLLAQLVRDWNLPPDLFVVVPSPGRLRIVFLRAHQPILTRLVVVGDQAVEWVAEIVRTRRHLENTRAVPRAQQRYAVLLLGAADSMQAPLALQQLDLLAPPRQWDTRTHKDWRWLLFERVMRSPTGQLAPLALRSRYLAGRVRRAAYVGACAVIFIAACYGSHRWNDITAARLAQVQTQAQLSLAEKELVLAQQTAQGRRITPALVQQALNLERQEIVEAASLPQSFIDLGSVIAAHPEWRVHRLSWHLTDPSGATCSRTNVVRPAAVKNPAATAEILLELLLTGEAGPRDRARSVTQLSRALAALSGVQLVLDPAQSLSQAAFDSTELAMAAPVQKWCLHWGRPATPSSLARP